MASAGGSSSAETGKKTSNALQDGDIPAPDPIAAQQELLITEIESADGHLANVLRTIFEVDPEKFQERLDTRIKTHDKEIERMCNFHYQGFIESVRGLLQVRGDVEKLKHEIQTTNEELQASGTALLSRGEELIHKRKIKRNIESAIESLSMCLPVLEMYGKLRDQMKHKRYYPALKTLEQLEHTYLPRVSKYRFAKGMCDAIPKVRESIKDASMTDLKDFLESIRKHSERIGEHAMKIAAEHHNMDISLAVKKSKKRKAPRPPNPFTGEVEQEEEEEDDDHEYGDEFSEGLSAQDLIDFSPVYRCLHIYSVLGAKEAFESYYRKQRRKQARLALQPPANMDRAKRFVQSQGYDPSTNETLEGYKRYFHDIIGFFVVEDHILSTTSGLVNRAYIDELWEMALSKIVATLRTHTGFCTDPGLMLQIKNLMMLFCHALRGYGFTVSQLYDLLLEIRDQYSEILMKKWVEVFNTIFNEDNYTAITVETEEEYIQVTSKYPFRDSHLESEPFPKRLPFSHMVPNVYGQVKEYIYACLKFSEDLHLSDTEKEETMNKGASTILGGTLRKLLLLLIHKHNLTLAQLIQISINMNYLEQSCVYLEDFISNITGAERDSAHVSKLQGTSMFKDARSEADEQIYKQINEKIDEFFDLESYDWVTPEPSDCASDYVRDLVDFLHSTFLSFTNLPMKVAQTSCMSACKHISSTMMDLLTDNEMRTLSLGALQQLNLDLMQCERFAASNPVPGLNDGTLQMAFIDLRQLLDLFINWDWSNYIADYGKDQSKYLRVSPATCIVLLERLKDADKKKNNLFATFKRNERDKKKLLETVLKQLRQLVNGQSQFT